MNKMECKKGALDLTTGQVILMIMAGITLLIIITWMVTGGDLERAFESLTSIFPWG